MASRVILGIHSNVDPTDGFTSGHAWITVSTGGHVKTYGLWPDEHPRTVDNGPGSDVRIGLESPKGLYSRYYQLTPTQAKRLNTFLKKAAHWRYTNTCASWASEVVYYVTKEDVDADDWFGFETPREISKSIKRMEAKNPTSPRKPKVVKVARAGSSSSL